MRGLLLVNLVFAFLFCFGCNKKDDSVIIFATSADYPPFEFYKDGVISGFDIDLASLVAEGLGKKADFKDMQFSSILASLQNGTVDAGISTIAATGDRKKNFDFSDEYYEASLSIVYLRNAPINNVQELSGKKIGCQLGTTMEMWLKKNIDPTLIVIMGNNNLAIESLKSGHVDGVLVDTIQASVFTSKNHELGYFTIGGSGDGYSIIVKKGSSLKQEINDVLKQLHENGAIEKLKKKWL